MPNEPKPKARSSDFHLQELKDRLANYEAKLAAIDSYPADRRDEIKNRTIRYIADMKKLIAKATPK